MSHEVKLGQLISGGGQRDAIHIAVAPVVAGELLLVGQDVGFTGDDSTTVGSVANPIGIVDPFLKKPVMKGDTFWLFLYPQSITSLRHDWAHPAFTAAPAVERPDKEASRQWIADFAGRIGQTYETLMDAAQQYDECGDYEYDNSERYKKCWDEFPEFWKHYTILTGVAVVETDACPFTCSC